MNVKDLLNILVYVGGLIVLDILNNYLFCCFEEIKD